MNLSFVKKIAKRVIYPHHYSSGVYTNYLKSKGAKIGEGTFFYSPQHHPVDETSCPFIEIGKNCRITQGVQILGHDYSYAVLRPTHHCMLLKAGVTSIGNNVFIGINSIIMMGATIGDNVIIGAGSVVSKNVPSNVVIAGNPAKTICSLDEYYKKNLERFELNSHVFYSQKSDFLGRKLREDEMSWYVALWKPDNIIERKKYLSSLKVDGDDKDSLIVDILGWNPKYDSYDDFLQSFEHVY